MKQLLWVVTLICGLGLLACSPIEPLEITRVLVEATAVTPSSLSPTWTPLPTTTATLPPTITSAATPTPQSQPATPTPLPTATLIPSPTPETILLNPIQELTAEQTLPINNDLLFLSEQSLQIWQPQTAQVTTLSTASNADASLSGWRSTPDKQTVVIAQTPNDDAPGFTLFLFEAQSRQVRELWSESDSYLFAYALAVDGRSTAIITSGSSLPEREGAEVIQVINHASGQVTTLTNCTNVSQADDEETMFVYKPRCQTLVAAPDGQTWLWQDVEGVQQGGLHESVHLLVPHDYIENDPSRYYSPTDDWSPNGRYQLLSAQRFKGRTRWVLDMSSGQTIEVPNSVTGLDIVAYWQWTPDNRLFTVRPPIYIDGETNNFAELWHIEGNELVQDASLVLPNPQNVLAVAPSQLGDGRFAFILNHNDPADATTRNLYLITSFDQPPQPLISLPPLRGFWDITHSQSLTWTPDASGVLYMLVAPDVRQPFYIPADGSILYDLTKLLGSAITDLLWLP